MIALDSGDKIQGDASTATKVDYTLHGLAAGTITQLADGQLPSSIGDLYTASGACVLVALTMVNTDSSAITVNLYLLPSSGTARHLIPVDLSLEAGYSLIFDGQKFGVMDTSGHILYAVTTGTPTAHKDSHDPNDGGDKLDTANAAEIAGVQAAGAGTSHSFAAADHVHQIQHAITDNHLVTIDDASVADDNFARFTANGIEGLTAAEAITALLASALPENTAIILTAAPSADGKYSGIVEAGTLGETVAYGECVYLKAADSQWYLAKADVTATSGAVKIGVCLVGGNDNDATVILLWGKINAATKFPSFGITAPVFISAATAGALTSTAPTGTTNFVVRIVGHANTADELFFHPDNTYLELK